MEESVKSPTTPPVATQRHDSEAWEHVESSTKGEDWGGSAVQRSFLRLRDLPEDDPKTPPKTPPTKATPPTTPKRRASGAHYLPWASGNRTPPSRDPLRIGTVPVRRFVQKVDDGGLVPRIGFGDERVENGAVAVISRHADGAEALDWNKFSHAYAKWVEDGEGRVELCHRVTWECATDGKLDVDDTGLEQVVDRLYYNEDACFAGDTRLPPRATLLAECWAGLDTTQRGFLNFTEARPLLEGQATAGRVACYLPKLDALKSFNLVSSAGGQACFWEHQRWSPIHRDWISPYLPLDPYRYSDGDGVRRSARSFVVPEGYMWGAGKDWESDKWEHSRSFRSSSWYRVCLPIFHIVRRRRWSRPYHQTFDTCKSFDAPPKEQPAAAVPEVSDATTQPAPGTATSADAVASE